MSSVASESRGDVLQSATPTFRQRLSRATVTAVAVATVAAFSLAGPAPTASAATNSVNALAAEFTGATSGTTIQLTQSLGGVAGDDAVAVPASTSVTLDLAGEELTLVGNSNMPGLGVPAGSSLTIIDSVGGGILNATGGTLAAGIGGGSNGEGGTTTINGGEITANGGTFAAGIGGGYQGAGGTLTIHDGTVNASGGFLSAGIGGGYQGDGGTTTINGGTTHATGGVEGAGIGGGYQGAGGTTTISGGTTHATGGKYGAGIGGGSDGDGGTTTIHDGTTNATGGGLGAGIGGGYQGAGGTTTISGGTTNATGGDQGAGIGGGHRGDGGTTTINGGTTNATGGVQGAGIGGGNLGDGGTTTVNDGTVNASGGSLSAGIGGGYKGAGAAVMIDAGATVTASAVSGIAVGPGASGTGFGSLLNAGELTIPAGNSITVRNGVTVTNTGTIINRGTLKGAGDIVNSGIILNVGTIGTPANVSVHNFTVALDGNGGTTPAALDVLYAGSFADGLVALTTSTRIGFTFTGWFTAATGGTQVTNTTDLGNGGPKSMTLYAQWSAIPYTVTFDTGDGSAVAPMTAAYNTTITEPTTPTRTGHTFTGWFTTATGGTAWDFTTPITDNITLYAQWDINTYTITFDTTGGTTVAPVTTDYNTPASEPTAPTRAWHTFAGWFTAAAGGTQWDFTHPVTEGLTLHAQWSVNPPMLAATGAMTPPWSLLGVGLLLAGAILNITWRRCRLGRA